MIYCPVCQSKELEGAIFCDQCGAQLVQPGIYSPSEQRAGQPRSTPGAETDFENEKAPASLWIKVLDTGEMIQLPAWPQTTLGRVSEGQDLLPDVDLTAYHAYELGVSRLHAMFIVRENRPHLLDLGSANGTKVNETKLTPKMPQALSHGDKITLGKLQLQILIQNENTNGSSQ